MANNAACRADFIEDCRLYAGFFISGTIRPLMRRCVLFSAEDFSAVARELGFEVVKTSGAGEEPEYTYHSEKQAGEGFWAVAPGAGDISEGMVWVSKKSS